MKKIFFVFVLFLCLSYSFFAQFSSLNNYVTRTWSSVDGLPGNSISDILQSHDGYIYLGTYECLVKFDGYDFHNINKYSDTELSFISARAIFEDSSRNIWIGSNDEGVQILCADGRKVHLTTADGLPNNSIRSFVEDRYGNVWIGTAAGVVYVTKGGSVVEPETSDDIDLSHVLVNQLYCDTAGRIWMLTSGEKGLYLCLGNTFKRYKQLDFLGNYNTSSISQDENGDFWIGLSQDGIVRISNEKVELIKTGTVIDYEPTNCIFCDSTGNLWFGTEKGLILYSEGKYIPYLDNQAIASGAISKIIEDREHNIWVGTDNGGVGKISLGKFNTRIINSAVNAICEDDDNVIWIGSDDGLLCYINNEFVSNELTDFCKGIRIRHITKAENGDLLINCYSKPAQIRYSKENGIEYWSTDNGLAGNKTRVSLETSNGTIYCGTTTGLSIIHSDGEIKNHTVLNGFDCEYIMSLYEDYNGVIWIGTDGGGIYLMENEQLIRKITTEDGLAGNVVFKINQDKDKNYWICTGTGISCYEKVNNKFVNFTTAEGLGSDSIFQMIVDDNNYAWMLSNRGISSIDYNHMLDLVNGKRQTVDCKFYNQNDGLKSSGVNSTALSMKDKYGRVWFTMADGFAVYDPVKIKSSKILPIVQLVEVQIDDQNYNISFDNPIMIPPEAKHITIRYTGLSFTSSEQNRFSYKLEGFDNNFSDFTANRTVSYTNLKPGRYSFLVNVKTGDELISLNPAKVELIQQAFFYQHVWFWVIVVIFLLISMLFALIMSNSVNKKRQLLLETKIQMATVELEMAKDDSDRLLKNILPVSIADRMKGFNGEKTIADTFDNVTVLFSDIVGFTKKTSNASAEDIVSSLNDLITRFDKRAASMGVEKIKTIGDAYMAACGVPEANPKHAVIMLKFAMGMFKDLADYNKTSKIKFNIRVGLNSGKVIAGVIGQNKFIYDIWGDTVNVASRMESCCSPGHIRFTESVRENLIKNNVTVKCRTEECDIKGKGLMLTYEMPE